MKNAHIKWIFILATLCTVGIILTQVYWVRKAYMLEDKAFDYRVHAALRNTALNYWESQNIEAANYNIVTRIAPDYYVVQIDDKIDPAFIEHILKVEFEDHQLITDFEFCFYDCMKDTVMSRHLINMTSTEGKQLSNFEYPNLSRDNYYFGVHFPNRKEFVLKKMGPWYFSTAFILLVFLFLTYILFLILKQKRLSEIQKDFVNNMTHEFKTPLSSIQLAAEVLKRTDIVEQPKRLLSYATIIDSEATKLAQQIERVLQMAHAEKGDLILQKKRVNLIDILNHVLLHYQSLIQDDLVEIDLHYIDEEIWIQADALHIENVFSNLIDNAIKYKNDVKPIIEIIVKTKKQSVEIAFIDNGIGIAEEHKALLFDKFYRVPTGNIHNVKGFGLGLNYVQIILRSHGGDVKCLSKLGEGSTFTVTLPIIK